MRFLGNFQFQWSMLPTAASTSTNTTQGKLMLSRCCLFCCNKFFFCFYRCRVNFRLHTLNLSSVPAFVSVEKFLNFDKTITLAWSWTPKKYQFFTGPWPTDTLANLIFKKIFDLFLKQKRNFNHFDQKTAQTEECDEIFITVSTALRLCARPHAAKRTRLHAIAVYHCANAI